LDGYLATKPVKTPGTGAIPRQLVYQVAVAVVGLTGLINQSISVASSINKITRGERLLELMAQRGAITESGKDFLIAALDPMHDKQLTNLQGWPDMEASCSVVRCYKKSLTLSKPDTVTGNWDCAIQSFPIMNSVEMKVSSSRNNNFIAPTTTPGTNTVFPVTVLLLESGTNIDPSDFVQGAYISNGIAMPDEVLRGRSRLVGMGIEVNNTTAPLNKQGTVTVYRAPQAPALKSTTWFYGNGTTGGVTTPFDASVFSFFPPTIGDALLLAGSRQWKAEDGAYSVVPFCSCDNPPTSPEYRQPVFWGDAMDRTNTLNTSYVLFSNPIANVNDKILFQANKFTPSQSAGIYFTGLSAESSLQLQVNFYIESFPTFEDTQIVTLATPSAEFDHMALSLYQHALNSLPVGVPANFNGFGDWFAGIISTVSKVAAPLSGTLAPVVLGAGAIADSYLAAQSPKTKPRVKAEPKKPPREKKSRNPQSLRNENAIEDDIIARLRREGRDKSGRRQRRRRK